ncbi:MAG: hypothetical protein IJN57_03910 [Oscillospiraceae bacterium]|nr:hypothetical protein [Oscillospiraceae bacterium]
MTDVEKAIAMAYTGVCFLQGAKLKVFYDYAKMLMGREVFTHELPDIAEELKEKSKDDFLAMCRCDYETEPVRHGRWVSKKHKIIGNSYDYVCSVCGCDYALAEYDYCPNCGAKMDKGEEAC